MARCYNCRERLPDDPESRGARCPSCGEPLVERRRRRRRADGDCAAHPDNPAVGTCRRCGNYVCDLCATDWRDRSLCPACVDRALEKGEAVPGEAAAHVRQALMALVLGASAWGALAVGFVILAVGVSAQNILLLLVGTLVIFSSPLPAVIGVGQAVSALRSRGDHMILATLGLFVSGLHVGALIGMMSFGLGMNYSQ
jgi:hypothetical protein